jgi:hypothetical protein
MRLEEQVGLIKRTKYFQPLLTRINKKPIIYIFLVCGPSGIYSNVILKQERVDELCFRFKVSREVIVYIQTKLGLGESPLTSEANRLQKQTK